MGKGHARVVARSRAENLFRRKARRLDVWRAGVQEQAVGALFMAGNKAEDRESFRKAGFKLARPGGWDPIARKADMATDGVCAEVLYPSLGLGLYCIDDAAFQEALFRTYNDWMIDYCSKVPDRLYGIALISMYNVDHAIAEMERCKKAGMVGTMIWQVPDARLPFTSDHYERFWAASAANEMPVHLHILTGFGDSMNRQTAQGIQRCRIGVEQTREIEIGAVRYYFYRRARSLSQAENRLGGKRSRLDAVLDRPVRQGLQASSPCAEVADRQAAERIFLRSGLFDFLQRSCRRQDVFLVGRRTTACGPMTTRTRIRPGPIRAQVIERDMVDVKPEVRRKLLNTNCEKLYNLKVPASLPVAA